MTNVENEAMLSIFESRRDHFIEVERTGLADIHAWPIKLYEKLVRAETENKELKERVKMYEDYINEWADKRAIDADFRKNLELNKKAPSAKGAIEKLSPKL